MDPVGGIPGHVHRVARMIRSRTGLEIEDCLSVAAESWWRLGYPDGTGRLYVDALRNAQDLWRARNHCRTTAQADLLPLVLHIDAIEDADRVLYWACDEHGYDAVDDADEVLWIRTRMADSRSWFILDRYYRGGWTMRRIGDALGVSESRVCRVMPRALADARACCGGEGE